MIFPESDNILNSMGITPQEVGEVGLIRRAAVNARIPGRRPLWPPRPAGGQQTAAVLPSPNSLSTASTPPAEQKRKV
jgi:hypothetical protein